VTEKYATFQEDVREGKTRRKGESRKEKKGWEQPLKAALPCIPYRAGEVKDRKKMRRQKGEIKGVKEIVNRFVPRKFTLSNTVRAEAHVGNAGTNKRSEEKRNCPP